MKFNTKIVSALILSSFLVFVGCSQEPKEEVDKFINSLTNTQLEKMSKFVENMPTLMHLHEYTCKKCNHNNTVELKGLQDFF